MTPIPGARSHSLLAVFASLLWPAVSAAQTTQTLPPPVEMSIASSSAEAGASGPAGGEQQVSSTGAAIYTIPLEMPRGRNGIGPGLALTYNSRVPSQGPFGPGWSMSIPFIERMRPKFSDTGERFSLRGGDGSVELLSCDVSGGCLAPDSQPGEWRSRTSEGPSLRFFKESNRWVAYSPTGERLIFGESSAAQANAPTASGSLKIRWMLERVERPSGEAVAYTWSVQSYPGTNAGLDHVNVWQSLQYIDYPARIRVTFAAASGTSVACSSQVVWTGLQVHSPCVTTIAAAVDGVQASAYSLTYQSGRLHSVQRTGDAASGSAPAIVLTYGGPPPGFRQFDSQPALIPNAVAGPFAADFDGDGRDDIAYLWSDGRWYVGYSTGAGWQFQNYAGFTSTRAKLRCFQGDFDGVGRHGIVCHELGSTAWRLTRIDGTTATESQFWIAAFIARSSISSPSGFDSVLVSGDFDGDGATEVAAANSDDKSWVVVKPTDSVPYTLVHAVANRDGSRDSVIPPGDMEASGSDVNGDGKSEIVFHKSGATAFVQEFWGAAVSSRPLIQMIGSASLFADANRDGLADNLDARCGQYFTFPPKPSNYSCWYRTSPDGGAMSPAVCYPGGDTSKAPYYLYDNGQQARCHAGTHFSDGLDFSSFGNAAGFSSLTGEWVRSLAFGRFDGDTPELFVAVAKANGQFDWRRIKGDVVATTPQVYSWAAGKMIYPDPGDHAIALDVDGSGLPDLLAGKDGANSTVVLDPRASELTQVDNGRGGRIMFTYTGTGALNPVRGSGQPLLNSLPMSIRVLKTMTVTDDVAGWSRTTTYNYSGGVLDQAEKVFRGFARVTESRADGTSRQVEYNTTAPLDGHPSKITELDGQGLVMSTSTLGWTPYSAVGKSYPVAVFPASRRVENGYQIRPPPPPGTCSGPATAGVRETVSTFVDGLLTSEKLSDNSGTSRTLTYEDPTTVAGIGGDARWTLTLPQTVALRDGGLAVKQMTQYLYWPFDAANPGRTGKPQRVTRVYCSLLAAGDPAKTPGCQDQVTEMDYDSYGKAISIVSSVNSTAVTPDTGIPSDKETITVSGMDRNGVLQVTKTASLVTSTTGGSTACRWDANDTASCIATDALGRAIHVWSVSTSGEVMSNTTIAYHPRLASSAAHVDTTKGLAANEAEYTRTFLDGFGRPLRTEVGPLGAPTTIQTVTYDSLGRPSVVKGPMPSGATSYPFAFTSYGTDGRVAAQIASRGDLITLVGGAPDFTKGAKTSVTYSGDGMSVTDPDGRSRTYLRNGDGKVTSVCEVASASSVFQTSYGYAIDGQLASIADSLGRTHVEVAYDPLGRPARTTDYNTRKCAEGQAGCTDGPGVWASTYAPDGKAFTQTDPAGRTQTVTLDGLGRPDSKTYWAGAPQAAWDRQVIYEYDLATTFGASRLSAVYDSVAGTRKFARYDALGRVREESRTVVGDPTTYVTMYDYDVGGRLTTLTYPPAGATAGPADQIAYHYLPGTSRLQYVAVGTGAHIADFADYDALGQAATITYGNGTKTRKTLDPWSGALTTLVASPPNQTAGGNPAIDLINVSIVRTGGGDISKLLDYRLGASLGQTPNHVDFTYGYDMQGRLASETLSALAGTVAARPPSILFDPHATRVDPYQALISTASFETSFDRIGAMLSGYDLTGAAGPTLRTFQYGVDGMPSRITYGSTPVDSYYDDTGTRVLKYGAQTTVYVGPHFEVRGGVRHRYVFANGTRIALLTPTDTYYFHGDHLGSTRAITNGAGTAVWSGSYEPFGRLSSETGTRVSPYLFTGQELDGETGLYYFGARYYDPSSGMFTSADSILARPYDPQSLNRYAYVGGKPLSRFDPDGHNWLSDFGDWLGKGLRWAAQHSNGGFVPVYGQTIEFSGVPAAKYFSYVSIGSAPSPTDPSISHDGSGGGGAGAILAPPAVDIDVNVKLAQAVRRGTPFVDMDGLHAGNAMLRLSWFYSMVRNKGPWDFKQLGRQYQEFGNYHYGLVGSAAGVPEELLLRAAGWAQIRAGTSADTWQSAPFLGQWQPFMPWPWGRPPYGDDPRDQLLIRMGSSDYTRMNGGSQP